MTWFILTPTGASRLQKVSFRLALHMIVLRVKRIFVKLSAFFQTDCWFNHFQPKGMTIWTHSEWCAAKKRHDPSIQRVFFPNFRKRFELTYSSSSPRSTRIELLPSFFTSTEASPPARSATWIRIVSFDHEIIRAKIEFASRKQQCINQRIETQIIIEHKWIVTTIQDRSLFHLRSSQQWLTWLDNCPPRRLTWLVYCDYLQSFPWFAHKGSRLLVQGDHGLPTEVNLFGVPTEALDCRLSTLEVCPPWTLEKRVAT